MHLTATVYDIGNSPWKKTVANQEAITNVFFHCFSPGIPQLKMVIPRVIRTKILCDQNMAVAIALVSTLLKYFNFRFIKVVVYLIPLVVQVKTHLLIQTKRQIRKLMSILCL